MNSEKNDVDAIAEATRDIETFANDLRAQYFPGVQVPLFIVDMVQTQARNLMRRKRLELYLDQNGETYTPENSTRSYERPEWQVYKALNQDINRIYARLEKWAGIGDDPGSDLLA